MYKDDENSFSSSVSSENHELQLGILDPWAEIIDLDPEQWTRLYDLVVKPSCTEKGLYILHEKGHILSVTPKRAYNLLDIPESIEDPFQLSKKLFQEWPQGPIVILDRQKWNAALDKIQHMFNQEDDILSFLLKAKDIILIEEKDGIVICPHPFDPWRGISPDIPTQFLRLLAPVGTRATIILAIYEGSKLWASILLGLRDRKIILMTCIPLHNKIAEKSDWRENLSHLLTFAEKRFASLTLGLICQRELVDRLGFGPKSWPHWKQALESGELVCLPNKEKLVNLIKGNGLR